MGLIWLTGRNAPDHNSLWRFLDSNREAISQLFKQSVKVAVRCDMVGMAVHAVDGTKIKSSSSWGKMRSAEALEKMQETLDRSIADFMTEIERSEQEEMGEYRLPIGMHGALRRKEKIAKALTEVEQSQQERVHPCEPEARLMKNRRVVELSYNAEAVADDGIIVAADVNEGSTGSGPHARFGKGKFGSRGRRKLWMEAFFPVHRLDWPKSGNTRCWLMRHRARPLPHDHPKPLCIRLAGLSTTRSVIAVFVPMVESFRT
jgi:hypothetical protein